MRMRPLSWIISDRWNSLSDKQKRGFAPIDPDFVIELMSHPPAFCIPPSRGDKGGLQQKMLEYLNCGVGLGWLINPDEKQVEIYRVDKDKEILDNPSSLSGEDILPGLTVNLIDIF